MFKYVGRGECVYTIHVYVLCVHVHACICMSVDVFCSLFRFNKNVFYENILCILISITEIKMFSIIYVCYIYYNNTGKIRALLG